MTKTLVAGGELVIADLTFTNKNWRFKESHDFWTGFKAEQLQKWLEEAELEIIKLSENDNYHFCFNDLKVKGKYVKVPLLIAHCRKNKLLLLSRFLDSEGGSFMKEEMRKSQAEMLNKRIKRRSFLKAAGTIGGAAIVGKQGHSY